MSLGQTIKLAMLCGVGLLISCAPNDQDKIAEAQACLDKATRATVDACLTPLSGINSEKANMIRCSASYIRQGFDNPKKFVDAFAALDDSGGSGDPMLGMLGILAFDSVNSANEAFDYCNASGSSGFIRLASLTKMATAIGSIGNLLDPNDPPTQAEMEAAVNELITNPEAHPETLPALGGAAIAANETCNSGESSYDEDVCEKLGQAVCPGLSADDIGDRMAEMLKNNTPPPPCT